MPSSRQTSAFAATSLAALSLLSTISRATAQSTNVLTYKGCFSSSTGLTQADTWAWQSTGHCQPICTGKNQAVLALNNGNACFCGSTLPPQSSLVDDSQCNVACTGWPSVNCGGDGSYSVYVYGSESDVANAADGTSSASSSASSSAAADSSSTAPTPATSAEASTTTAAPSIITSVAPGTTVVITQPAAAENTASPSPTSARGGDGGSSTNVAAVAAGVVVGVVAIAAIVGGVFYYMRRKRRNEAEQSFKRTQVNDFMASGAAERKPGTAGGWSTLSDSRLDPEAGRRNSNGSIADDQDYSRRILRVANPDR